MTTKQHRKPMTKYFVTKPSSEPTESIPQQQPVSITPQHPGESSSDNPDDAGLIPIKPPKRRAHQKFYLEKTPEGSDTKISSSQFNSDSHGSDDYDAYQALKPKSGGNGQSTAQHTPPEQHQQGEHAFKYQTQAQDPQIAQKLNWDLLDGTLPPPVIKPGVSAPKDSQVMRYETFFALLQKSKTFRPFDLLIKGASESNIATKWHYYDEKGTMQGPFSTNDMDAWYIQGYFDDNLMISFNTTTNFQPFKLFFECSSKLAYNNYVAKTKGAAKD